MLETANYICLHPWHSCNQSLICLANLINGRKKLLAIAVLTSKLYLFFTPLIFLYFCQNLFDEKRGHSGKVLTRYKSQIIQVLWFHEEFSMSSKGMIIISISYGAVNSALYCFIILNSNWLNLFCILAFKSVLGQVQYDLNWSSTC